MFRLTYCVGYTANNKTSRGNTLQHDSLKQYELNKDANRCSFIRNTAQTKLHLFILIVQQMCAIFQQNCGFE